TPISPSFLTEKQKGDIVEAIVGELAEYEIKRGDGVLLDHCRLALDELIGYVFYAGESAYFFSVHGKQHSEKKEENNVENGKQHEKTPQKFDGTCHTCGKVGHKTKDCWIYSESSSSPKEDIVQK